MIFGHKFQSQYFEALKKTKKFPPFYLFFGPEGIGKFTFALELSLKLTSGSEIFVISSNKNLFHSFSKINWVFPKETISIEEVKNLINFLNLTSFKKKIALIDEAHCLSFEAQNSLLKILEEPPKNTLLILISHLPGQLLDTILSRAIKIQFFPLAPQEMVWFLKEKSKKLSHSVLKKIIFFSRGSPKRALEILKDHSETFSFYYEISNFFKNPLSRQASFLASLEKKKIFQFLEELALFLEKELTIKKDKKTLEITKNFLKIYYLIKFKKIEPYFALESFLLQISNLKNLS